MISGTLAAIAGLFLLLTGTGEGLGIGYLIGTLTLFILLLVWWNITERHA